MALLLCVASLLLALSGGALLPTQPRDANYWALVREYRSSIRGAPERLAAMPQEEIRLAVDGAVGSRAADAADLRAAAVMHSEAWYRAVTSRDASASFHVAQAERLLDAAVRIEPKQLVFAIRWVDVMMGLSLELNQHGTAKLLAGSAVRLQDTSPARLRALSYYREGLSFEHHAGTRSRRLTASSIAMRAEVDDADIKWWAAAAGQYQHALELDPTFHSAALHLGRVRMLQRKGEDAARLFAQAERSDDPREVYLALLLGGSLDERAGRFDAAELKYREALRRYPAGQAAPLALSQLLSRTAREAEARAVLAAALNPARGRLVEPLWTYLRPARIDLGYLAGLLDELRVEVLR